MVAVRLMKLKANVEIELVEPADTHWYQPAWTLVGAGTYNMQKQPNLCLRTTIPSGRKMDQR